MGGRLSFIISLVIKLCFHSSVTVYQFMQEASLVPNQDLFLYTCEFIFPLRRKHTKLISLKDTFEFFFEFF